MLPQMVQIQQQIVQAQMMEQQGIQSPIDWVAVLRETLDQFDPTLPDKLLTAVNPVEILLQLMQQHIRPTLVSPALKRQISAVLSPAPAPVEDLTNPGGEPAAAVPGSAPSPFGGAGRESAGAGVTLGRARGTFPGDVRGRALSEAAQ